MTAPLITSIRVELLGGHAHIHVWARGGKAGTLVVAIADAPTMFDRISEVGTELVTSGDEDLRRAFRREVACNLLDLPMDHPARKGALLDAEGD